MQHLRQGLLNVPVAASRPQQVSRRSGEAAAFLAHSSRNGTAQFLATQRPVTSDAESRTSFLALKPSELSQKIKSVASVYQQRLSSPDSK